MAMESSAQELERILNGDYKDAFNAQDYFSVDNQSTCHVFDVTNDEGIMKSNVDGDGLVKMIKVCTLLNSFILGLELRKARVSLGTGARELS